MSSENTMMAQISLCRNGPSRSGNVRAGRLVCALPIGASVAGWRLRCRLASALPAGVPATASPMRTIIIGSAA